MIDPGPIERFIDGWIEELEEGRDRVRYANAETGRGYGLALRVLGEVKREIEKQKDLSPAEQGLLFSFAGDAGENSRK